MRQDKRISTTCRPTTVGHPSGLIAAGWAVGDARHTPHRKISVVFPGTRPPRHPVLIEGNRQRSHDSANRTEMLPDGRSRATWETHRPRLYENYLLQWEW